MSIFLINEEVDTSTYFSEKKNPSHDKILGFANSSDLSQIIYIVTQRLLA